MALGKAIGAEPFELLERALGEGGLVAPAHHAVDELVAKLPDVAVALEGRHRAAELVGLDGVNPAHSIATRIACSWKSGTPSVLPRTCSSSGFG